MEAWLILAGICVLFLVFVATLLVLLVYSGLFVTVEVGAGRPPIGQVVIAYKFARGPYKDVGPLFTQVTKLAPDRRCLGIYYDDPQKVEAKRLRYVVGSVLAEGTNEADQEQVKKFEAEGFQIFELPEVENIVRTSFPIVTTLSIFIAVQKVYPKLAQYVKENSLCAHPFLEVYDGKTMYFMAPLSRQGSFYVPEALQDFEGEEPYESFYSDESTQDLSQSTMSTFTADDSQAESSVLESSRPQEERERSPEAEPESPPVSGPPEEEQGSDEESTSSFEEVKFEAEGAKGSSVR